MKNRNILKALIVAQAVAFAAASTALVIEASEPPAEVCGDHNGNGRVDANDALRVLLEAVGLDGNLFCPCFFCPGDGDDDDSDSNSGSDSDSHSGRD